MIFDKFSGEIICKLVDEYNFKFEKKFWPIDMLANNYAYFSQQIGTIHNYYITVKMWMQKLSLSFTRRLRREKWRKK